MNNFSSFIADFVKSPLRSISTYSSDLEKYLLDSLYIASIIIAVVFSLFPLVHLLSPSPSPLSHHHNDDTHSTQTVDSRFRYTSLVNHINSVTRKVSNIERGMQSSSFIKPGKYTRYKPPMSIFLKVSASDLINKNSPSDCFKLGISFTNLRETTQYPIATITSGSVSSLLMFNSADAITYLHNSFLFFTSRNILIRPHSDETISYFWNNATTPALLQEPHSESSQDTGLGFSQTPSIKDFIIRSCYIRFDITNFFFIKIT